MESHSSTRGVCYRLAVQLPCCRSGAEYGVPEVPRAPVFDCLDIQFARAQNGKTEKTGGLAVRYFAKLFGQAGEGNRIIYAESQFEESEGLRLLATHLLDGRIGEAFFDDSSRMKRDLLGPFANVYLDSLDFEQLRDLR